MKAHLTNKESMLGLRAILMIVNPNITPTPTATPVNDTIGMLADRYLKPINIVL